MSRPLHLIQDPGALSVSPASYRGARRLEHIIIPDLMRPSMLPLALAPTVDTPEVDTLEVDTLEVDTLEVDTLEVELVAAPADDATSGLLAATPAQLLAKRAIDVLGALLLLALLSSVMLVVALAVRLTSPGPSLYTQERVGRNGTTFRMSKFRSMYRDADDRLVELTAHNEASGPVFKIRDDPRVTPVGRLTRKLSLDELPQLFNVLRGQMSLVGPRPPLPHEVEQYTTHQRQRLEVKPGLTCIWQVSGRADIDFDEWVDMDLQYIRDWTLQEDLRLLLRTVPAVLSRRGAY